MSHMMLSFLILFWKALWLSHLFFTGQVFNVNLSYRKTIIITLTTLQLLERESPYVHYCFCSTITDGGKLHCILGVKSGSGGWGVAESAGFLVSLQTFNFWIILKKVKSKFWVPLHPNWLQNKAFFFSFHT